ncbi:MAG: tRNA-intron lyase [Candidatus Aenigmarchaeota archaeon]|nr:tRNA-intron lyase [Candidatus Aenigmarchaeota archaeon]
MNPSSEPKPVSATLQEHRVIAARGFQPLAERHYGKVAGSRLELGFVEALYLLERGRIAVKQKSKKLAFPALLAHALEKDRRIQEKYAVYRDLRDRGLVVKTGFKFGCDFRVYQRGVGVKRGPKEAGEHTKWIVYAVPEDYTCAFQELSRAVRLAHSIRARMLWGIVDNEGDVTFLEVVRIKP